MSIYHLSKKSLIKNITFAISVAGLLAFQSQFAIADEVEQPYIAAEDRVSTVQPFEKGDILVAATIMDDPNDDHAGTGRLIQYDSDLNEKGVLWIKGTRHKIGGLAFAPDKTLWGFSQLTPSVLEVDPSGVQRPVRFISNRTYSSVTFAKDGSLFFGEHLMGKETGSDLVTTKFNILPGTDKVGDGYVFKHAPDGELIRSFATKAGGNKDIGTFLAVTTTVLTDDDTRMIYVSETGWRVMQYDLKNDKQLPDLLSLTEADGIRMVLNLTQLPDGRLLISTGAGVILMDPNSGEILRKYEFGGWGWAAVAPSIDGKHILVGNFFEGDLIKVRLEDGAIIKRTNIGQRESLSGIVQFPG
jgi:hypothetical protein